MKRLLHYLKAHPVITIMAPLFKMLEATLSSLSHWWWRRSSTRVLLETTAPICGRWAAF